MDAKNHRSDRNILDKTAPWILIAGYAINFSYNASGLLRTQTDTKEFCDNSQNTRIIIGTYLPTPVSDELLCNTGGGVNVLSEAIIPTDMSKYSRWALPFRYTRPQWTRYTIKSKINQTLVF